MHNHACLSWLINTLIPGLPKMSKKLNPTEDTFLNLCNYDAEFFDDSFNDIFDTDTNQRLNARRRVEEILEQKALLLEIGD